MSQTILLRGANQLLTLRGPPCARRGNSLADLGIIPDGSMLIRDGVVLCVGPTRRIENLQAAKTALEIPVLGKVVMPGLVDASIHLSLRRSQNLHRSKRVADFHEDSLALLRSCLQHGTVAAEINASADGRDFHSDIAVLRKLAKIGSNPIRVTRTWRINRCEDLPENSGHSEDCRVTLDTMVRRNFIDAISIGPRTPGNFDSDLIVASQMAGLPLRFFWAGGSLSLFQTLLELLNPESVTYLGLPTAGEAAAVAQTRAISVLGAGKQLFEGPKRTAGYDLVNAGAAIALSSGYDSTIVTSFSMQMSVALAVARLGLTAEQAVTAATINAAYATGCGKVSGSLEPGKQADVLVLNLPDYRELPLQFGINHTAMVLRQGHIVFNRTRWRAPVDQSAYRVRAKLR